MSRLLILASFALALGCVTKKNAYTDEDETARVNYGAVLGGVVGGVAGSRAAKSKRGKVQGALAGAVIGGALGGAIGAYQDRQEEDLRRHLRSTGVSVTRRGDAVVLNMPGNITFDSGSAVLYPSFSSVLDSVVLVLKKYDKTAVEVAGHTDATGNPANNQALSLNRANAVARYLSFAGVGRSRLNVVGYGDTLPIADNSNPEGRAANRRVELILTAR